jgi:hypothetical protein
VVGRLTHNSKSKGLDYVALAGEESSSYQDRKMSKVLFKLGSFSLRLSSLRNSRSYWKNIDQKELLRYRSSLIMVEVVLPSK